MKKGLVLLILVCCFLIPTSSISAINVTGEIEHDSEHPTLTNGEITEEEWRAGEGDGMDGVGNPGADDPNDASVKDRFFGWLDDLADSGGEFIGDVYNSTVDSLKELGSNLQDIGHNIADVANSVVDRIADAWNGLSDGVQDLILTVAAVIAAVAVAVALAAAAAAVITAFTLSAGVIAAIVAGAAVVGGLYYLAQGGTDDFTFFGAFTSALTGGVMGGFLTTSLGGAVVLNAVRALGTHNFKAGLAMALSRGSLATGRYIVGTMLKNSVIPFTVYGVSLVLDFVVNGNVPSGREMFFESLFIVLTAPIGGAIFKRAASQLRMKNIFSGMSWGLAGINLGGATSFALASIGEGNGELRDYIIGSLVATLFVYSDVNLDKFIVKNGLSKSRREVTLLYETAKRFLSERITDSFKGEKPAGQFYTPHVGDSINYSNINASLNETNVNPNPLENHGAKLGNVQNLDVNQFNGNLTAEEVEAIEEYLKDLQKD
ncbi:hypothetical protein [Aquisalibacillus elongatus]|uniref:Uncharacterized protein n=1 Tax=Aquisalibacillus elongatus TaxID=485577 RepID=A0A3N5AYM7_9BACI|nr:hypothetical protein [Aquisalibacillus elongatus]RPF50079.1 hypothetical protein EDC24_2896 [Aquisalibacillus elongatus]